MTRLQAELQRLYLPPHAEVPANGEPELAGPDGHVRCLVLELNRPRGWEALAPLWQGVQADLELPAPAIAVNGIGGYQLWFSLAEPVPASRASALLAALCRRYLEQVRPEQLSAKPSVLPPVEAAPGQWAAFLASDLASLFADEPWLDLPPSPDAQADLLSRLRSIKADELQRAEERLGAAGTPAAAPTTAVQPAPSAPPIHTDGQDPRSFLLAVMNDPAVAMQLRIEAAKALLPYLPTTPTR